MEIEFIVIGKTNETYLIDGVEKYRKRINRYNKFHVLELSNIKKYKSLSSLEIIRKEGDLILQKIKPSDYVVLLDETGKNYSSIDFSKKISLLMLSTRRRLVFLVGGAYGVSESVYFRSNEILSLSKMTFSHQMVRLFFMEQLYRSFTLLNNEPYHHQ